MLLQRGGAWCCSSAWLRVLCCFWRGEATEIFSLALDFRALRHSRIYSIVFDMAALPLPPPSSIDVVVPETPPCSQAAAQTPSTLLSQPARCSHSDGSPLRISVLGELSCIGDTLRIGDEEAAGCSSSEGEDIMQSYCKDYKSIPHLDSYSTLAVDDSASLPALSEQQVNSPSVYDMG
jgi:hypothetical protein